MATVRPPPCTVAEPLEEWVPAGRWCWTCALPSVWLRRYTTVRGEVLCGVTTVSWCDECKGQDVNYRDAA